MTSIRRQLLVSLFVALTLAGLGAAAECICKPGAKPMRCAITI